MLAMCEDGIRIARVRTTESARALFLAYKGYFVSFVYGPLDSETAFQIKADSIIGLPSITEEYRHRVAKRLEKLERTYSGPFDEAIEIAIKTYDLVVLASVLIMVGNAAGQRALYLDALSVEDRARAERQRCRRALFTAKGEYLQDELGKANSVFNLANQIRFFGETTEAAGLVESAIAVAEKLGDSRLLKKARWLKESLETGKIPDYLAGERRE